MRKALRSLTRDWRRSSLILTTLALGFAAQTSLLTVVVGAIAHPLPYRSDERSYFPEFMVPGRVNAFAVLPERSDWSAWAAAARSVESIQLFGTSVLPGRLPDGSAADFHVGVISPGLIRMAGVTPLLGRLLVNSDTARGTGRVTLVSEAFWRQQLGAQTSVVGTQIGLNAATYTIVGVMPSSFRLPNVDSHPPELWLPTTSDTALAALRTLVILRRGVSKEAAERELGALHRSVSPKAGEDDAGLSLQLVEPSAAQTLAEGVKLLYIGAELLMLIACVNVAHLVLFQADTWRRDVAIRLAIGAPRRGIFVQLLARTAVIVAVGGTLGTVCGWAFASELCRLIPFRGINPDTPRFDSRVLAVSLVMAVVITLILAFLGYWRAVPKSDCGGPQRSRGSASTSRAKHTRRVLLATEMAMATLLLSVALLLVRTVRYLSTENLGFDPDNVAAVRLDPGPATDASSLRWLRMTADLQREIALNPHVSAVSAAINLPPNLGFVHGGIEVGDGRFVRLPTQLPSQLNRVGNGFFSTLRVRMLAGSGFTDTSAASREIIINSSLSRLFWSRPSAALGQRIRLGKSGQWKIVTAVVNDAAFGGPLTDRYQPAVFEPLAGSGGVPPWIVFRARERSVSQVIAAARTSDIGRAVPLMWMLEADALNEVASPVRGLAVVALIFGGLALGLAMAGLYAVTAYSVAMQRREIGVRLALGAEPRRIAIAVVQEASRSAVSGLIVGSVAAFMVATVYTSVFVGLPSNGMWMYGFSAVILLATAAIACAFPISTAVHVSPLVALADD